MLRAVLAFLLVALLQPAAALRMPVHAVQQRASRTLQPQMALPSMKDAMALSDEEVAKEIVTAQKARRIAASAPCVALPPHQTHRLSDPVVPRPSPTGGPHTARPRLLHLAMGPPVAPTCPLCPACRSCLSCARRSRQGRRCGAHMPQRAHTRCPPLPHMRPLTSLASVHAQVKPHLFTHTKHRIAQLNTLLAKRAQ